jgi:hypothetical protein
MTAGLSGNVGPAMQLGADVRGDIISIAIEARLTFPSPTFATNPIDLTQPHRDVEFDLTQLSALLVPCARYKWFVGCAVVQGGMFVGGPDAVGENPYLPVFGLGPRIGFEVPFAGNFAFTGFGEALFAPLPVGIDYDRTYPGETGAANVEWTQSPVSGFFGLGVLYKWE